MRMDALDELRTENPFPELLPAIPLETLRRLPDREPPADKGRAPRRGRVARRTWLQLLAGTCAAAALAFFIVSSLPSSGSGGGFSVAQARAAIGRGEQQLRRSSEPVLFTKVAFSTRIPGQRTIRTVQRMWQAQDEWRASTTSPIHGMTDVAMLGGVTAYYMPRRQTVYVNRVGARASGSATPSVSGGLPDPDPVELAIGALLNVEPAGETQSASSFPQAFKKLMALPGAKTTRHAGLVSTTVRRKAHFTRIIARAGSLAAVLITQSRPDPSTPHGRYVNSFRFFAYHQRLSPASAARAFNLLRVHSHAKVDITHHAVLHIP